MTPKKKLQWLCCVALYPMVSTFLMTLIWQIFQQNFTPFLGGYYFKWVYLYSENNEQWLSESYLTMTRWIYFAYLAAYLSLALLTVLVLFRRKGKAVCIWGICGLWIADIVWIVLDIVNSGVQWQFFILIGEHLIFVLCSVLFSVYYIKLKREFPQWFKKKKRKYNLYQKRF